MKNQESSQIQEGLHVAIIMDGNGRWATRQGKPRFYGHQVGAETVRKIVEAAPENNISVLTLYAFSSDNWQRPKYEVNVLMKLFRSYLQSEIEKCLDNGVKLSIIGRRDRLNPTIVRLIESAEEQTALTGRYRLFRPGCYYGSRQKNIPSSESFPGGVFPVIKQSTV